MKKQFAIAICLLFFFSLSVFTLNAQTTQDPVKEAFEKYIELQKLYQDADNATDIADSKRDWLREEEGRLLALLGYAKLEQSENNEDIVKNIIDILDAVGVDPLDVLTDAAAAAIKLIIDTVDAERIWEKKLEIETALSLVSPLANKWSSDVEKLAEAEAKAKEKMDAAFLKWQTIKGPLTYKLILFYRTCLEGEVITVKFKMNKVYEWVKWYVDYVPQGTDTGNGKSTQAYFAFTGPSVDTHTDYTITAKAKVAGTGEIVSDNRTVTVEPEGIFFSSTALSASPYQSVTVVVKKNLLLKASIYVGGKLYDSKTAYNGKSVQLNHTFSGYGSGVTTMWIVYEYYKDYYTSETTTEHHSQQITFGDKPLQPIYNIAKTDYKGQIRLTWTEPDFDGGSPITDYEYQYSYYRSSGLSSLKM